MSNITYVVYGSQNGMQIPTRVQVRYSREYCKENNLDFGLSKDEMFYDLDFSLFKKIINGNTKKIIIFSDILIANSKVEEYLGELIESNNEDSLKMIEFHLTFSNEIINAKELLDRIERIKIHSKFAMSINDLLDYLKKKRNKPDYINYG
tara:strand:+ start:439 stop:888 length:450 start_codon:yes stop_codon:yes gene_type:complete